MAELEPISIDVVEWGHVNTAEAINAVLLANMVQQVFRFRFLEDTLPLNVSRYRLPNGGIDLDQAACILPKSSHFRSIKADRILLLTSEPYSDLDAVIDEGDPLGQGLYFIGSGLSKEDNVDIVSTYIWEQLPFRAELPALFPSGRCALEPYLLLAFALVALEACIDLPYHSEARGCPFDLNYYTRKIDRFFEKGVICRECDMFLRSKLSTKAVYSIQLNAAKRLFNRSHRPTANYDSDYCFISYGKPDSVFSKQLYEDLTTRGIPCWFYGINARVGEPTWREIIDRRRAADKILIICSAKSLKRDSVLKELEGQVDEAPDKIVPVSTDIEWQKSGFLVKRGQRDLKPFLLERNYADFTKLIYEEALERLVIALDWY
ncbi:TIR domain-containing protein [bacterium]|nr:MAG: TIR domain-containing protein [bacterium]